MNNLHAVVLGASGAVGRQLIGLLASDHRFSKVIILARRNPLLPGEKFVFHQVDFDKPDDWAHLVQGDVFFSAFGTTLKKAGSKENQYKIDYTYQYNVAKAARDNGVNAVVLISAAGANENSKVFYSRMKGELDLAILSLGFEKTIIIKPSLLVGHRDDVRFGEIAARFIGMLMPLIPYVRRYRPVKTATVASAMINSVFAEKCPQIINPWQIFTLAKS